MPMPSEPETLSRCHRQIRLELCGEAAAGHLGHMHHPLAAMRAVEADEAPDICHPCDPPMAHLVQLRLYVPFLHVLAATALTSRERVPGGRLPRGPGR
uniref:Uncharacterized protein n=1 Tax=Arundo donax TaxID=35708 RepID=A0A0A9HLC0_ARUDO